MGRRDANEGYCARLLESDFGLRHDYVAVVVTEHDRAREKTMMVMVMSPFLHEKTPMRAGE